MANSSASLFGLVFSKKASMALYLLLVSIVVWFALSSLQPSALVRVIAKKGASKDHSNFVVRPKEYSSMQLHPESGVEYQPATGANTQQETAAAEPERSSTSVPDSSLTGDTGTSGNGTGIGTGSAPLSASSASAETSGAASSDGSSVPSDAASATSSSSLGASESAATEGSGASSSSGPAFVPASESPSDAAPEDCPSAEQPVKLVPLTRNPRLQTLVVTKDSLRRKMKLLEATVRNEMSKYFPANDPFADVRHKTCAVIGSSGCLLLSQFGPLIDSMDAQFRINSSPVSGYSKHVGSKEYYRFVTEEAHKITGKQPIFVGFVEQHLRAFRRLKMGLIPNILLLEPEVSSAAWHEVNLAGNWCTTGFLATYFAMQICDEVHLFGFNGGDTSRCKYHYYDNMKISLTKSNHAWKAEHEVLRKWHQEGRIVLHSSN